MFCIKYAVSEKFLERFKFRFLVRIAKRVEEAIHQEDDEDAGDLFGNLD